MIFGFVRKENIFLLQHYHPIRHIHCQIAASEFLTDFDSWDMLTIIGSRSPIHLPLKVCFGVKSPINVVPEMSLVLRKPVFGVSDPVPHKQGCTATEDN